MASKTKAATKEKEKEEAPEKEATETPDTPLPLLDLSDAAVKKLIRSAKKRGYVTHDQINSVLPSEEVNSERIEDVLAIFKEEAESESGELVEVQQKVPAKSETKEPTERTDDPVRIRPAMPVDGMHPHADAVHQPAGRGSDVAKAEDSAEPARDHAVPRELIELAKFEVFVLQRLAAASAIASACSAIDSA